MQFIILPIYYFVAVKIIAIYKPQKYVKAIDVISKTMNITSFPGYHSATKVKRI